MVPVPEEEPPFNVAVPPAAMLSLPAFEKLSVVNKFSVPETKISSLEAMCNYAFAANCMQRVRIIIKFIFIFL